MKSVRATIQASDKMNTISAAIVNATAIKGVTLILTLSVFSVKGFFPFMASDI
jgi:hypothetical protein